MFKDDLKGAPAIWKFLAQVVAGLILVFAGIGIVSLNNPFGNTIFLDSVKWPVKIGADTYHIVFWADLLLIVWTGLLMNATNFIDGLDGLAGGLGFIAAIVLSFVSFREHQAATGLMAAVFAGSIGGFLLLNVPPAKIFLGDVGSMFIGLMLAVLTFISGGKLATLLLVFGLVILDALYVVIKRIIKGKNPMTTPDQTHIHHRFLRAGLSATSTLILLLGFSVIFGLIGLIFVGRIKLILLIVMAVISVGMFVLTDLKGRKIDAGR
jgi:UDP-GlcNAc:undecaprenyl-phosphate GlcNAc-1-phosphate transferase